MKSYYYATPNAAVAVNYKVGSATLARAIISAHYPELDARLTTPPGTGNGTAYPAGVSADDLRWHWLCPICQPEERGSIALLVRDPVEKFRSACKESMVDSVDDKLDELESAWSKDVHFWPQSRLTKTGKVLLYRFPDHLDDLARDAGLSLPLVNIENRLNSRSKPDLSKDQVRRVKKIYREDVVLFESISEPGQVWQSK